MMFSQPLFIPLYFDETEEELWQALQRIEPEKRSVFIKDTLRQELFSTLPEETPTDNPHAKLESELDSKPELEGTHDNILEEKLVMGNFSVESLFSASPVPGADVDMDVRTDQEVTKFMTQRPWDIFINSVIGEENDEAVIAALQHSTLSEVPEEQSDNRCNNLSDKQTINMIPPEQQEFDLESLQVAKSIPSAGYEYMMKHIIGTEEDEVVLKLLRGTENKQVDNKG